MGRRKQFKARSIAGSTEVVSLFIDHNGKVRVDEKASDDVSYGRRLANRLTRSIEASPEVEREVCQHRTTWARYRQMIRNNSLRYESVKPREFNLWSYIAVSPGRKEPKRGC